MLSVDIDLNQIEQQQHSELSFSKLNEFRKESKLCDIILKTTDGNEIHAHKCVLKSSSEYFDKMLNGEFVEKTQNVILIKDIRQDVLQYLINFMYTKQMVTIDNDNVEAMLNGADILQLTEVRLQCAEFLMEILCDKNCLRIKNIADSRLITDLSKICLGHVLKRFLFISKYKSFMDIDITQLTEFLKSNNLNAPNEENVYNAVIKWVKYDESNRKHLLPELLNLIRLVLISKDFLLHEIEAEPLIYSNPECLKIFTKVIDHFNFKCGDSLSKIITNIKPRIHTKKFITEFKDDPQATYKIPDCKFKSAINLFAYFDNYAINTDFPRVEWDTGMNENNFFKEWDKEWRGLNSLDEESDDD